MKKIENPFVHLEGYNCFGCAPHNPLGLKMEFYEDGDEIVSRWTPKPEHQGWLNTLHGGIQSVMLDEVCGWVIMRKLQTSGVTSKMETRYLKPISTDGGPLTVKGRLKEMRRNIALVEAEILDASGEICSRAVCTYFTFPQEKAYRDMHFQTCKLEGEE